MTRRLLPEPISRAMSLGRQLRVARERAGFTLDAAATASGRAPEQLDGIERGALDVRLDQIYALGDLYGANVDVCVWPHAPIPVPAPNR